MRSITRRLAPGTAAVLLLASAPGLVAQTPRIEDAWRWVRFGDESGLPSNRVVDVVEAADGVTWAVTDRGLAWYDGYVWTPIGPARGSPDAAGMTATPDAVRGVLVVFAGRLFRGDTRGFREVALARDGVRVEVIAAVALGGEDLLIVAEGGALLRYAAGRLVPESVRPGAPPLVVQGLSRTRVGGVWITTRHGLYRWGRARWSRMATLTPDHLYVGEDTAGGWSAYIFTPQSQRGLWDGKGARVPARTDEGAGWIALDIAPSGEMALLSSNGEIRWRSAQGMKSTEVPVPFHAGSVLSLAFRQDGDLWVGTSQGLYLLRRSARLWTDLGYEHDNPRYVVNEILRTRDGTIWIATGNGVEVHPTDGPVRWIKAIGSFPLKVVTGLAEDDAGGVWLSSGAWFEGAWRWDGKGWRHFGPHDGLAADRVHKIRRDRRGRLWFLGMAASPDTPGEVVREPGAFVYDQGRFTRWGVPEGLRSGRVYAFGETPDGALWFGTEGGLSRWRRGAWTHWRTGRRVFTLAAGSDNRVWFSDQVKSFAFIDERDQLHDVDVADGLAGVEVWDLRVDSAGWLWAATRTGLGTYHDGTWSWIGAEEGLGNLRLWPVLPFADQVYVGSTGSGVRVLARNEALAHAPRVRIEPAIESDGHTTLRWSVSSFWGLPNAAGLQTRYRLDDGPWTPWRTERQAVFDGLRGGRHRVDVQAKGMLGDFGAPAHADFSVPLPILLRPVVVVPFAALLLGLLMLARKLAAEKRRRDSDLRDSEARTRAILDATPDAILAVDPSGRIEAGNAAATTLFGYLREELTGMTVDALIPGAMAKGHVLQRARDLAQSGRQAMQARGMEIEARRRDGTSFPAEVTLAHLRHEGASIVLAAVRDISERQHVEEVIRQSESRFRTLAEVTFAVVWRSDPHGQLVGDNASWRDFTGQTVEEMKGGYWTQAIHPDDRDRMATITSQAMAHGTPFGAEARLRRADGAWRDMMIRCAPLRDARGSVVEWISAGADVTERVQAELALRRSETLLTSTQRLARIGSWELDLVNGALTWTDEIYRLFEIDPSEFGANYDAFLDAVHPDDRGAVNAAYKASVTEHQPFAIIHRLLMKDGRIKHVEERGQTFYDEEGRPLRSTGTAQDVTARQLLEAQLRQAQKMEAVGHLTGGIAHDFNNILSIILSNTEFASSALPPGRDDLAADLNQVRLAVDRGIELVKRLLGFSRTQELSMKVRSLRDLLDRAVQLMRRLLPESIDVRFDAPGDNAAWAMADAGALEQILLNLGTNARDAMPRGGVIDVRLSKESLDAESCEARPGLTPGDYHVVTVSDTGSGIPAEILPRLFDPFFTTKDPGAGTGLGMSMIYGLMKQHQGYLEVESEVGRGTTVTLMFPAVAGPSELVQVPASASAAASASAIEAPASAASAAKAVPGVTILLVEDEEPLRHVAKRILEKAGYAVVTAHDGAQALDIMRLRSHEIALVVSDLVMPNVGGVALLETLQQEGIAARFLFVSGYSMRDMYAGKEPPPHVPVVQKPYTREQLTQRVDELLREPPA